MSAPVTRRPARSLRCARAGFTLLEVVVASAILVILVLAISSAYLPVQRSAADTTVGLDMDQGARRFMDELRRDLRTSGTTPSGVDKITVPDDGVTRSANRYNAAAGITISGDPDTIEAVPADLLRFERRTGPDADADWSSEVVYRIESQELLTKSVPSPLNVYRIVRIQDGIEVEVVRNVTYIEVQRVAGANSIDLTLELTRGDPNWRNSEAPQPYTRTYRDRVEMLNGAY